MEKKKRVGISTELYEIYLRETSKEARREVLEASYWDEDEIEVELKKRRISFNDFVMKYIEDFELLIKENEQLQEEVDAEINSNHHPICKCDTCEEQRDDWRREEAERAAEEYWERREHEYE